ncbi:hypothetical protein GXM_03668 [Nostoc sphaeroides CCNUC1]|uniref:Uncharacterized protein n=1 Tax=Nostoc sphaeroides CCNUC1 TaxID=2653204 RepID=A0A5P8W0F3_9NOSO|nr:hypothetical protein GXM_03668 [Nostoc sphaeroides CCNUC1]
MLTNLHYAWKFRQEKKHKANNLHASLGGNCLTNCYLTPPNREELSR